MQILFPSWEILSTSIMWLLSQSWFSHFAVSKPQPGPQSDIKSLLDAKRLFIKEKKMMDWSPQTELQH